MILAATGHRPNKLGGYTADVCDRLRRGARRYLERAKPAKVISGMALGWDMAWAGAAVELEIPFIAAVPFIGQADGWPLGSRGHWQYLLLLADEIVTVCEGGYAAWKFQKRNEWMVDHCDRLVALWDGSPGGTKNCIDYAVQVGKPVENLWEEWVR